LQRGCGKCVKPKDRELQCSDRRWRNICLEPNHFQCATTENCILPQWIADGVDDCADGSDEDLCALGLPGCNETKIQQITTSPFDVDIGPKEGCSDGEFRCMSTNECISVTNVLDGEEQCADGSDESPH
uniref:Low-density lipoprotein receptor domain class A n=1 Tax=Gongylonema pulchrum TaxID=637853 RepID=A0A183EFL5_9BILA